ncbi:MAG: uridine kinase [Planctomycetota bacterium]
MRRLLIGIAGGSGSGKTTLARALQARFAPHELLLISLDGYYRDRADLTLDERRGLNFDHPSALDEPLLREHLAALKRGEAIEQPVYDYSTHARSGRARTESASVILLEGILALSLPTVRELLDLKIFVETASDLRVLRRLRRDVAERGRSVDSVIAQYMATVRPMHERYIEPTRELADLVVPGERDTFGALWALEAWVRAGVNGEEPRPL